MKVLIVCSKNSGNISPFISDQADTLVKLGIHIEYFCIEGKGYIGYLRNRKGLLNKIDCFQPDLIHAHYGLSGLLANMQRRVPVVTTYHGSDINVSRWLLLSRVNMFLSAYNIFVSKKTKEKAKYTLKNQQIVSCGVDLEIFSPINSIVARKELQLNLNKKYVLFAGSFSNAVKNSKLAKEAVKNIADLELLELKGFSRERVSMLMNAVNLCLLTSFSEGSPQFIKEAMACGIPIVSVDVGDVKELIDDTSGCYISSYNADELTMNIMKALMIKEKTNGRDRVIELGLDALVVAKKLIQIYKQVIK